MKKLIPVLALLGVFAWGQEHSHSQDAQAQAQDHNYAHTADTKAKTDSEKCPLHDQHMKGSDARFEDTKKRGDASEGMGFSQTVTTHHFYLTPAGGIIQVTANSANDKPSVDAIAGHMRRISKDFSSGNFSIPMFVHNEEVPGIMTMAQHKSAITYRPVDIPNGARVVITTLSPEALKAVHDFLRYQIEEHRTGDPLQVGQAN